MQTFSHEAPPISKKARTLEHCLYYINIYNNNNNKINNLAFTLFHFFVKSCSISKSRFLEHSEQLEQRPTKRNIFKLFVYKSNKVILIVEKRLNKA